MSQRFVMTPFFLFLSLNLLVACGNNLTPKQGSSSSTGGGTTGSGHTGSSNPSSANPNVGDPVGNPDIFIGDNTDNQPTQILRKGISVPDDPCDKPGAQCPSQEHPIYTKATLPQALWCAYGLESCEQVKKK